MADSEHVEVVRQGAKAIEKWREEHPEERLDLQGADLRAADLSGADLSGVFLYETVLGNTNLTDAKGLETCRHDGPSTLDHRTLAQSGPLPLAFLRGCGLSDWEIEATKLYQTGLASDQVMDIVYHIADLHTHKPVQFYSCFISYSSADDAFARRLHADLQDHGVRCWFAPEDLKIGDRIRDTIDLQIRLRDKLLVVLFATSIESKWVEDEVEAAMEEEGKSRDPHTVLFPIRIDDAVLETDRAWTRKIHRSRHIGDFTTWKDHDAYRQAFDRLLRDLQAADDVPMGQPG